MTHKDLLKHLLNFVLIFFKKAREYFSMLLPKSEKIQNQFNSRNKNFSLSRVQFVVIEKELPHLRCHDVLPEI
jgi:hypothetical protein